MKKSIFDLKERSINLHYVIGGGNAPTSDANGAADTYKKGKDQNSDWCSDVTLTNSKDSSPATC